jgi:hypothetical protein
VLSKRQTRNRRTAAAPLAALWAAFLLTLGLVLPVLAGDGPTKLDNPNVSPHSGSPTTTIEFSVRYRNRTGSPPDKVVVLIDGVAHAMTAESGTDWKTGVQLHWSTRLPAGTHTVTFEASEAGKFTNSVGAGTITITAPPPPTPKPTTAPPPTPKATPKPTAVPAAASEATPSPTPGGAYGGTSSGDAGPADPSNGGRNGSSDGSGTGTAGGSTDTGSANGSTGGPGGSADDQPGAFAHGSEAGAAAAEAGVGSAAVGSRGPGWGALASALDVLGVHQSPSITFLPLLVSTSGGAAMAFAFAIFGKKRRDGQPPAPDEVLHANAARGLGQVPGGEVAGVVRTPSAGLPVDVEAGMPRWRRPSLLEARKADPTRYVASPTTMSFASGAIGANDARERRVIRYRVVRLLDAPDELRSVDIGQLDQGDEVQLLERSGAYWLVLCPDGRQGWLHKMTLGDIVSDANPAASRAPEGDDDFLGAFLAARARA